MEWDPRRNACLHARSIGHGLQPRHMHTAAPRRAAPRPALLQSRPALNPPLAPLPTQRTLARTPSPRRCPPTHPRRPAPAAAAPRRALLGASFFGGKGQLSFTVGGGGVQGPLIDVVTPPRPSPTPGMGKGASMAQPVPTVTVSRTYTVTKPTFDIQFSPAPPKTPIDLSKKIILPDPSKPPKPAPKIDGKALVKAALPNITGRK